jgi:hypothetical protein
MAKQPPKAEEKSSAKPAFNVYTIDDRGEGKEPFWLKIGAAFEHKDDKGFNIVLQALPIDGRLVLREPKEPE